MPRPSACQGWLPCSTFGKLSLKGSKSPFKNFSHRPILSCGDCVKTVVALKADLGAKWRVSAGAIVSLPRYFRRFGRGRLTAHKPRLFRCLPDRIYILIFFQGLFRLES